MPETNVNINRLTNIAGLVGAFAGIFKAAGISIGHVGNTDAVTLAGALSVGVLGWAVGKTKKKK